MPPHHANNLGKNTAAHPLCSGRVMLMFHYLSPVGASIYCSPHHRLRSRLTRHPTTGDLPLGITLGEDHGREFDSTFMNQFNKKATLEDPRPPGQFKI
jgi:hypothetical protein